MHFDSSVLLSWLRTFILSVHPSVCNVLLCSVFVVLLCFCLCLSVTFKDASFNPSLQKIKRRNIFCCKF